MKLLSALGSLALFLPFTACNSAPVTTASEAPARTTHALDGNETEGIETVTSGEKLSSKPVVRYFIISDA